MIKYKDLDFNPHSLSASIKECSGIRHAVVDFPDGSRVSILKNTDHRFDRLDHGFYCSAGDSHEVLSNRFGRKDSVKGWLSEKQVNDHLIYIQKNPLKK